jgi:glucose dehydrogenase
MHRMSLGFCTALRAMIFPAAGFAQGAPDLRKPPGKEWLTIGGDWHNTRYSTLTQINGNNVKNLKGAWVSHVGSGLGQKYSFEGTPLVSRGILPDCCRVGRALTTVDRVHYWTTARRQTNRVNQLLCGIRTA